MSKFPRSAQNANFWHLSADISGLAASFWKCIVALKPWVQAGRKEYHEAHKQQSNKDIVFFFRLPGEKVQTNPTTQHKNKTIKLWPCCCEKSSSLLFLTNLDIKLIYFYLLPFPVIQIQAPLGICQTIVNLSSKSKIEFPSRNWFNLARHIFFW